MVSVTLPEKLSWPQAGAATKTSKATKHAMCFIMKLNYIHRLACARAKINAGAAANTNREAGGGPKLGFNWLRLGLNWVRFGFVFGPAPVEKLSHII